VWSCSLGDQPFALVCVTKLLQSWVGTLAPAVMGVDYRRGRSSGSWHHSPSLFPYCSFPQPQAEGYMSCLESLLLRLSFLVCKMGTTSHFLSWFEICGWKGSIVTVISDPLSESILDSTKSKPSNLFLLSSEIAVNLIFSQRCGVLQLSSNLK